MSKEKEIQLPLGIDDASLGKSVRTMVGDLNKLTQSINAAKQRMRELGASAPTGSISDLSNRLKEARAQLNAAVPGTKNYENSLKRVDVITKQLNTSQDMLNRRLGVTATEARVANTQMGKMVALQRGVSALGFGGAVGGAFVIGNVLRKGFDDVKKFETGMRNVNTIVQVSQEKLDKLGNGVLALQKKLGTPSSDLIGALYQATSAGVKEADSLQFIETATKAAIAGLSTTEIAVDGLTSVLNAYHLSAGEAERISDIFFQTVKLGKTTFSELSHNLNVVIPIAAATGIKFEQIAAAIASLTKQGIPTNVAVTQIRQGIIALNENLGDGWTKTLSLQDAFQKLRDMAGGSNVKLREMTGNVEALTGVLAMTGENALTASSDLKEVKGSLGAMGKAFNEQRKSIEHDINEIKGSIDTLIIQIEKGAIPIIKEFIGELNKVSNSADTTNLSDYINFYLHWIFAIPLTLAKMTNIAKDFWYNLFNPPEEGKENLENLIDQLHKDREQLKSDLQNGKNTAGNIDAEMNKLKDFIKTDSDLRKEIEARQKLLNQPGISDGEKARLREQIKGLQDELNNVTLKSDDAESKRIDEIIKKIDTENELKELTNQLSIDVLESAKETLQAQLKITKEDENKIKLLKAIKEITDKLADIKPPEIVIDAKIEDIDITDSELKIYEARQKAEETLHKLRIEGMQNEWDQQQAIIDDKYNTDLANIQSLFSMQLITATEYNNALKDIESSREIATADLTRSKFQAGLSAARQIANSLGSIVGAGNGFVNALSKALEIAEAIASVIQAISIIGSIFSAGTTSAAAAVPTFKEGGVVGRASSYGLVSAGAFKNAKKYSIGGPIKPTPLLSGGGIPIIAHLDEMVLNKQQQAKLFGMISGSGDLGINRSGDVLKLLDGIYNRIGAMSAQIAAQELSVSVQNSVPDINTQVRKNKKIESNLQRQGIKFNQG